MNHSYPIILFNSSIHDEINIIESNVEKILLNKLIGLEPIEPTKPRKVIKPRLYLDEENDGDSKTIIGFFIITSIVIIISLGFDKDLIAIIFLSFVFHLFLYLTTIKYGNVYKNVRTKRKYEEEMFVFNRKEREYKLLKDNYENDIINFKKDTFLYKKRKKEVHLESNFQIEFKAIYIEEFDNLYSRNDNDYFNPNFHSENILEGVSEKHFLNYLIKFFGKEKIFINQQFDYYYPDFVLFHPNRFFIDIEIDEPYSHKTGDPIHYINKDTGLSIDKKRDEYFTDSFWVVVRFTENQVINNPEGCCLVLSEVCQKLNIQHDKNQFTNTIPISREGTWTIEEVMEMKSKNSRNKL